MFTFSCRELTRALLKHDYGINWHLQTGQLIPAVTNRANYIHWINDLLQLSAPPGEQKYLPRHCHGRMNTQQLVLPVLDRDDSFRVVLKSLVLPLS